jgi:hypothetical protein
LGFGIDKTVHPILLKKGNGGGGSENSKESVIFAIPILPNTERHDLLSYYIN